MKLISLELNNFRQHLDSKISFTDGLTGIIGMNGAGKSTILEGIAWALYGAPAVRGTNDTIRSKAAEGGAKASVTLAFELGGTIYNVTRTLDAHAAGVDAVVRRGSDAINASRQQLTRVVEALGRAAEAAASTSSGISGIAESVSEQTTASHEVARKIEQIAQMTEENTSAINSMAEQAQHLSSLARELETAGARFRV